MLSNAARNRRTGQDRREVAATVQREKHKTKRERGEGDRREKGGK